MVGFISTFVKRRITTVMIILIFIAFGFLSVNKLQLDLMPNMNIPVAFVTTSYNGAGSEEIENLITKPLEQALGTVANVKSITSSSSNGSSFVVLQFVDGTDINQAALDMREKVDLVKGALPTAASTPMVLKIDMNAMSGSMTIGVKSKSGNLTELQNIVDNKIKDRLSRQNGVASISASGGTTNQVEIVFNQDKLRGYGISENSVKAILASENINTPTGSIKQGNTNLPLRVEGQFKSLEDMRNIPITTPTGATIYLHDIADVNRMPKEMTELSFVDGTPSLILSVQKSSTANSVQVSKAIKSELELIANDTQGVELTILFDPADYITRSINNVVSSAGVGGILAIIILFIFLRDIRATLIVGVAMPVSIITTFALMYFAGMTINIMSLGGLTLGVGMLVDNSIVVIESIYRKIEDGELSKFDAAVQGTREVASSVVASTLTTIVVFLPITFAGGLAAQIFNQLSFTISFALFSSLFVALTFVPMASSVLLVPESEKLHTGLISKLLFSFNNGFGVFQNGYRRILKGALRRKKITAFLCFLFFVGTLALCGMTLGVTMMPESDEGFESVSITMPNGTVLADTAKKSNEVVEIVKQQPGVKELFLNVGGSSFGSFGSGSSDSASIMVLLDDKNTRKSAKEIEVELNEKLKNIAGADVKASATQSSMGGYGSGGIDIMIKGDDLTVLKQIANDLTEKSKSIPGVTTAVNSMKNTTPQANIVINREKAASYGISSSAISNVINTAVDGTVATTYKENGTEIDVRIKQQTDNFNYINDIQNILIPSPMGVNVPLYEVADIGISYPPVTISRDSQQRQVTVTLTSDGTAPSKITSAFKSMMNTYPMKSGYTWELTGSAQQQNDTISSLMLALVMALVLVYMVMAAEFESLIYPFIVMFSIPIAMSGGLFGLVITHEDISITSLLGLIMLSGVVINNAIVLIDYTNILIKERGMDIDEALLIAGPVRLRPIVMSVLTTTLGLVPMAISTATGAEMMKGLAIVVISGLLLSTLVTLLLIPVIFKAVTTRTNRSKIKKAERKARKLAIVKEKNEKANINL